MIQIRYNNYCCLGTGLAEVEEGSVNGQVIHLTSHALGRMSFGPEPKVLKVCVGNFPTFFSHLYR